MGKDSMQTLANELVGEIGKMQANTFNECVSACLKDGIVTEEEMDPKTKSFLIQYVPGSDGMMEIVESVRLNKEIFRVVTFIENDEVIVEGLLTYKISEEKRNVLETKIL